jgi:hypothetical protein
VQIAAHAPNHLGDGVMALPALSALASLGELTIHAPRWGAELYRAIPAEIRPVGDSGAVDLAVVFPPAIRAAWRARRARRRIGTLSADPGIPGVPHRDLALRRLLLTDGVPEQTHQRATFDALARAAGAEPEG